ncbi:hypothetical protein [Halovulum sp. GXIMD14793]
MRTLALLLTLTACTNEASHMPNPLLLPVHGLATAVDNAAYGAVRRKVKGYITENRAALMVERRAPGPAFAGLAKLAGLPAARLALVHKDFVSLPDLPVAEWIEQATIITMVHRP